MTAASTVIAIFAMILTLVRIVLQYIASRYARAADSDARLVWSLVNLQGMAAGRQICAAAGRYMLFFGSCVEGQGCSDLPLKIAPISAPLSVQSRRSISASS